MFKKSDREKGSVTVGPVVHWFISGSFEVHFARFACVRAL